jgi:ATP-dependent DNA ligase
LDQVAFDVLAVAGHDARDLPLAQRRALLEELANGWEPPLSLSPTTTDRSAAEKWFEELPHTGIEGLVIKNLNQPYKPGVRSWLKLKHRETVEVVCGAVIGPITQLPRSSPASSWTANCGSWADPRHLRRGTAGNWHDGCTRL